MTRIRFVAALLTAFACEVKADVFKFEIHPNDHICFIGNSVAARMSLPGHNHFEALLHLRFPKHNLVVRNLAWPADEVVLRPRAAGFGTPDEQLSFCKADVIMAFFGFNESFKGPAGLEQFKTDLDAWLVHTQQQNYSGKGAPRIVLVSPIAAEDLGDPNLPDATKLNASLELYTKAIQAVAIKRAVFFADVFQPSLKAFTAYKGKPESPHWTINNVHLNEAGDEQLAHDLGLAMGYVVDGFGNDLTTAIADKNFHWYHRHRIVDSYYVYGGRADLKFADGDQTNRDVMQREREILDVKVANRDQRIWDIAGGKIPSLPSPASLPTIDDSNVPPFLEVKTFFGTGKKTDAGQNTGMTSKTAEPDTIKFLSTEESKKHFKLAPGYTIDCFASEEKFPDLGNTVSMAFDTRGRLWVSTFQSYPQWQPGGVMNDRILILEDIDHDGKADRQITFADGLHLPISFQFHNGGILVSHQRELLFLKDTNGDDKADLREQVLDGFDSADSHHVINSFTYGPGGDLYFQEGTFQHSQVETPWGPVRCVDAGTYRYEPRSQKLEVAVSYKYANPHGIAFDSWGQLFISDASGGANYFGTAFSGYLPYPEKHNTMQQWFPKRVRPTSGCEFVSSRHFPDEAQGRFLLINCIGVQGILQHEVREMGSGFEGKEIEPLVLSDDPLFRPVAMTFAPDGSLYVIDWAEALIGHMQYALRDPLRDKTHGRIWRITYPERPLVSDPKIAGQPLKTLIGLLTTHEDRTRERVRQELSTRLWSEIGDLLRRMPSSDGPRESLEKLWLHQWHNQPNESLLKQVLLSPEPKARAAAVKVLCAWRESIPDALDLLLKAATDEHPRVRLEAVRAASWFASDTSSLRRKIKSSASSSPPSSVKPADIALAVLDYPMDYYLDYTLSETMRVLDVDVKSLKNPKAIAYVVNRLTNDELAAAPELEPILQARVERQGFDPLKREAAISALMELRKQDRIAILTDAMNKLDTRGATAQAAVMEIGRLLLAMGPALKPQRAMLYSMSRNAINQSFTREISYAAVAIADGKPGEIWTATEDDVATRTMLLDAVRLIPDSTLRAAFHPKITSLLEDPRIHPNIRSAALQALPSLGVDQAPSSMGILAAHLKQESYFNTAVGSLLQLPREGMAAGALQEMISLLLEYCSKTPADQRTSDAFLDAQKLGLGLCTQLPATEAKILGRKFRELSVATFLIKTVQEQMRYDTPEITVEAGKPFEVIFKNNDIMPHNMVFIQPGMRTEIGNAAQAMAMVPDKDGYLYIPDHKGIWARGKMLEPGQTERFHLTAPAEAGTDYEYMCTFPGHWQIMYGKLKVVSKLADP